MSTGLPKKSTRVVQLIHDAAACILTESKKMEHISSKVIALSVVSQRINVKILTESLSSKLHYITDLLSVDDVARPLRCSY